MGHFFLTTEACGHTMAIFRGQSKRIFNNFAPHTIHYAGKKNRSVFRSVNIIALFMQP